MQFQHPFYLILLGLIPALIIWHQRYGKKNEGTLQFSSNFFSEDIEYLNHNNKDNYFKNKLLDENLTEEEGKALSILGLKLPLTLEKIKKNYKKLVKIFHPDVNGNNKKAEDKFKEINKAYKTLLNKFKNDQRK